MKPVLLLCALLLPGMALASAGGPELDSVRIDLDDHAALQRGAKFFVNHCQSCHSAQYMRYSRIGQDLHLTDKQLITNLMFTANKVGATMQVAMPAAAGEQWFGVPPPDLSLVARSRGVDWLYTYLRGFYLDDTRPFGVNNRVFKDVAMPHVLGELQGWQRPAYKTEQGADGHEHRVIERLELVAPGQMKPAEYDRAVADLVNFLAYVGEPAQLDRHTWGWRVLLFLFIFLPIAYLLKKEYWRDLH